MKIPMKEKYVDEAFPDIFIYGKSEEEQVDLSSTKEMTIMSLPEDAAKKVVAAHQKFKQELYRILCYEDESTS